MKGLIKNQLLPVFLAAALNISCKNTEPGGDKTDPVTTGSNLHITGKGHKLGDVHPYYDVASGTWYMYYLANLQNKYLPKLLTSKDRIKWAPQELSHTGDPSLSTYYVLGVLNNNGVNYSFYGTANSMEGSESNDLLSWRNAPAISIPQNKTLFPAGARDPYVFFDPDENVYRCVTSSYRTNQAWGMGTGKDCSIGFSSTVQNNLTSWSAQQTELIRFPQGNTGEPEVSQMCKIGNRWYLFSSLYGQSNNGVGKPIYWIGDENKKILADNWQSKAVHALDGDDLCAAQIAFDGSKYLMWGWIAPNANGGSWGGHLSLPREIYQLNDDALGVKLDTEVGNKIRGTEKESQTNKNIAPGDQLALNGAYSRFDMSITATLDAATAQIKVGNANISINKTEIKIAGLSDGITYASYVFPAVGLSAKTSIRVIAESDILEVFIDDKWALSARIGFTITNAAIKIAALNGALIVEQAKIYQLKFIEEI